MINPLVGYGIRGFIWYQGEHNVKAAYNYRSLFPLLINDWRICWQQGYLPFLYVQLPNYHKQKQKACDSEWAELRESQSLALSQPNTSMICTIDIGEAETIHSTNKQDVGHRLALLAKQQVYGKDVQALGPVFQDYEINDDKVIIRFSETGNGLAVKENATLHRFEIVGKDQKFYWAKAEIKNNTVVVSAPNVKHPVAVRYA